MTVHMRSPVVRGPVEVLEDSDNRLRLEVVVYDEAGDRSEPLGLTPEALSKVAASFVGLPVLDRRHEIEAGEPGREIGIVKESRLEGTRIVQIQEWWDPTAIRAVREGLRQGFSISWDRTSQTELLEADGRLLFSDAVPLEVTRTYAPVVQGTGVRAVLNRQGAVTMAVNAEKLREMIDQFAAELGLSVPDLLSALATADAGSEEPAEPDEEREEEEMADAEVTAPAMGEASAQTAALTQQAESAIHQRLQKKDEQIASLSSRLRQVEERESRKDRRVALRACLSSGHLSLGATPKEDGAARTFEEMENDLQSVTPEALSMVLRYVYPSEPILVGQTLSHAGGSSETEAPELRGPDDIHRVTMRQAKKTGRPYEEIRREIVNSMAGTRPRGGSR